jgi:replicative DNA helicase
MALNGRLPSLQGWTEADHIEPGDYLFGETGHPVRVVSVETRHATSPCYEFTFRDGTQLLAGEDHFWPVREYFGSYRDTAATSKHLAEQGITFERALTRGKTKASKGGVARWRMRPTPALNLPEISIPLPPYLLGYWLGDGDSDAPRFTVSEDDLPHLEAQCTLLGARVVSRQRTHGKTFRIRFDLGTRATALNALREVGILNKKHIPQALFRASETQRREILQGLVDSDGYIESGTSRVEICFASQRLALCTVELIRTLGLYPRLSVGNATLNGRIVGTRYRIVFTAYETDHVSRLPRKAGRLKPRGKAVPFSQVRTVTAIRRVEPVPLTRIRVSSTGGTFLAGDGLVPVCDYT